MAEPAELAVNAAFEHLGIDATLDPDGAALPVLLIPDQRSDEVRFGGLNVQDDRGLYEIRASEWGAYTRQAVLLIAGERRVVQNVSTPDRLRLKRLLNTVAEA